MDKKKVKDYMTYDVVSVDIRGTVKDVIEKIQKTHHDGFPVVDGKRGCRLYLGPGPAFCQPDDTGMSR